LDFLLNDVVSLAEKQQIHIIIYLFIYGEQDKGLRVRAILTNALSGIFSASSLEKEQFAGRHFALP